MIASDSENSNKKTEKRQFSSDNSSSNREYSPRTDRSGQGSSYQAAGSQGGIERPKAGAMEVTVDHNIEKAMKILKRKLIKEGLFKELKSRRYYEKPSEKKKRKLKESLKKVRKDEARAKKNSMLF